MSRVILTGGPGTGKTTLPAALAAMGYATVEESARAINRLPRLSTSTPRSSSGTVRVATPSAKFLGFLSRSERGISSEFSPKATPDAYDVGDR